MLLIHEVVDRLAKLNDKELLLATDGMEPRTKAHLENLQKMPPNPKTQQQEANEYMAKLKARKQEEILAPLDDEECAGRSAPNRSTQSDCVSLIDAALSAVWQARGAGTSPRPTAGRRSLRDGAAVVAEVGSS